MWAWLANALTMIANAIVEAVAAAIGTIVQTKLVSAFA